ncbi:MAG: universal stress protein [Pseudomonadota bacterium]
MFNRILVPVDLGHLDTLERALTAAAAQAKLADVPVCYVAVTASQPGTVAPNPEAFAAKLAAFAEAQGTSYGIKAESKTIVDPDPTADLDHRIIGAAEEIGADLIVMQSHVPGLKEYIWPSNGGKVASHAPVSVMVVR